MWVADWDDTRLYAYTIAGNGNISDKSDSADIDLTGANDGPRGVTGHDGIVWVTASDPNGDSLTYSLAGTVPFVVNGSTGRISVAPGAGLNFENVSSYSFTMRVTDNKSPTGDPSSAVDDIITVTVTIDNVDEPGTVSFSGTPQIGSAVTATLSDPDGSVSGLSWQWSRRRGTSGEFSDIAGADGESYTPIASDPEHFLRATASYADGEGSNKSANGTVGQAVATIDADLKAVTVRVRPAMSTDNGGTDHRAILAAEFSATAVPAELAPEGCTAVFGYSEVDDNATTGIADDVVVVELIVIDFVGGVGVGCRYDVVLLPPAGFSTTPAGIIAENVEPNTSIDFLTSTGGPVSTVLLALNVNGAPDGARARFTLFSDCLPSVLVPTPPGGGIRPTRLVELRKGRYNMSAAFATGPAALDKSSGTEVLVVSNQTGTCEATLSVSHLPKWCTTEHTTTTASLLPTARRATLELEIRCRRNTSRTSAGAR